MNESMSRRRLLRSAGRGFAGITVGLPFLEEMLLSPLAAGESAVPVRAFNVFFGLGIPAPIQAEGFDGVLEPLAPLRDKLLLLRKVDQLRCDESGINAHYDGAAGAFTAAPPDGEAKSGGPSIDQVIRKAHYPSGQPEGLVPTLIGGTFFRRSRVSRYIHSYLDDGTAAARMQETPRALFNRIFGVMTVPDDPIEARRYRLKRSVLDAVVDQYRLYTGNSSPLGVASKRRIADHLERIREHEQRAYSLVGKVPENVEAPPTSKLLHGGDADPGGEGIDITLDELSREWRLLADIYALGIQMDRARFGSITFLAAGERIRLTGDYEYGGRKLFTFDDGKQHDASGSAGCSHEWWHKFDEKKPNEALRAHAHMKMREVAYFLGRLAAEDSVEANGKTILDNALITVSTESGDGRHNDVKRELSGVFHAISGAGGRFKTGQILDLGAEGLDVYNTMLAAMDCRERLGPKDRPTVAVDGIRA